MTPPRTGWSWRTLGLTTSMAMTIVCCSPDGIGTRKFADPKDTHDDITADVADAISSNGSDTTSNRTANPTCKNLWTAIGNPTSAMVEQLNPGDRSGIAIVGCGASIKFRVDQTFVHNGGFSVFEVSHDGEITEASYPEASQKGGYFGSRCPIAAGAHRIGWIEESNKTIDTAVSATSDANTTATSYLLDSDGKVLKKTALPKIATAGAGFHIRKTGELVGLVTRGNVPWSQLNGWFVVGTPLSNDVTAVSALGAVDGSDLESSTLAHDGGLYAFGTALKGSSKKANRVVRISAEGKLIWTTEVDATPVLGLQLITQAHFNGAAVIGGLCDCLFAFEAQDYGTKEMVFQHISSTGQILTSKVHPFTGARGAPQNIAKTHDGYLVFSMVSFPRAKIGHARRWRDSFATALLWKLDKDGNVRWNRYVGETDYTPIPFIDMARIGEHTTSIVGAQPTPDGHILLGGRVPAPDDPQIGRPWFRRLGPMGERDCAWVDLCKGMTVTTACDDGDPCTRDTCSPGAGCIHLPQPVMTWCGGDEPYDFELSYEPCNDDIPDYKACQHPEGGGKLACLPVNKGWVGVANPEENDLYYQYCVKSDEPYD